MQERGQQSDYVVTSKLPLPKKYHKSTQESQMRQTSTSIMSQVQKKNSTHTCNQQWPKPSTVIPAEPQLMICANKDHSNRPSIARMLEQAYNTEDIRIDYGELPFKGQSVERVNELNAFAKTEDNERSRRVDELQQRIHSIQQDSYDDQNKAKHSRYKVQSLQSQLRSVKTPDLKVEGKLQPKSNLDLQAVQPAHQLVGYQKQKPSPRHAESTKNRSPSNVLFKGIVSPQATMTKIRQVKQSNNAHNERIHEWLPMLNKHPNEEIRKMLTNPKTKYLQDRNQRQKPGLQQQVQTNQETSPQESQSELDTMNMYPSQPAAPKLSVAAKAGEMQIFSDSFNYGSYNTAQAVRRQPNSYNGSMAMRNQPKEDRRLIRPQLAKETLSAMTNTIQAESTEYSSYHPTQHSLKEDRIFKPVLQGQALLSNSHHSSYNDKISSEPASMRQVDDLLKIHRSRQASHMEAGTHPHDSQMNTPQKSQFQAYEQNKLNKTNSNDRLMIISASQKLFGVPTYDDGTAVHSPNKKVHNIRNSINLHDSEAETTKGRSLPPKRLFNLRQVQDPQASILNNSSILQPIQDNLQRPPQLIPKSQLQFNDQVYKHGNSSERRVHNKSIIQSGINREQRMLIDGHPLSNDPVKLNGTRLRPVLEGRHDNNKVKQLLPEVTGQNILNAASMPAQFNYSAQMIEQFNMASPKPDNPFMNKMTSGTHQTHFVYDYLFVQVTEAQFLREYMAKIKLNERICDTRICSQESTEEETKDETDENRLSILTPEKNLSQSLDNIGTDNETKRKGNVEEGEEVKEVKRHKQQVDALVMLPYTVQGTQFDTLRILSTDNIVEAYNEQLKRMGLPADSQIDREKIMRDFIRELSVTFGEQNKKFKITVKKNYINDILTCSKGAQNLAQQVILVIADDSSLAWTSSKKIKRVKRPLQPASSDSEAENKLPEQTALKAMQPIGQKTPQVFSNKIPSTIYNRRGYDSENESKSFNLSTTASSNLPQFGRKRNDSEENTPKVPRKIHARSLSQIPKSRTFKREEESEAVAKTADEEKAANLNDRYLPCKAKIFQNINAYDHLKTHTINRFFADYNEFIRLVFKFRGVEAKYISNIPVAIKIAKRMGVVLTKNQLLPATLKVRENSNMIKEKLIFAMCQCLQKENEIDDKLKAGNSIFKKTVNQTTVATVQSSKEWIQAGNGKLLSNFYKCFVGKGNNSMLVRTLFKSRFWWLLHDKEEDEKVNFLWTQLRKKSIMESLKCFLTPSGVGQLKGGQSNEKFKKRKITSAQSRSPEHESPSIAPKLSTNNVMAVAKTEEKPVELKPFPKLESYPYRLYNKIEDNFHLSNKKALLINMKHYYEAIGEDPFNALPVTFHIKEGLDDPEFFQFQSYYESIKTQGLMNIWIIKPGENTNRGQGIQVAKDFIEIKNLITENTKSKKRTCIVQKYIHNPLLIHKRKFDIRTYAMVTSVNGNYKAYCYEEGYLRTSCREFNVSNLANKFIHLTNDAIQKHADDYGKFEPGNKMSYLDFQTYLDKYYTAMNVCFERDIVPQIKKLTTDCFRATWGKMDPFKRVNTFECYGLDFMIDDDFKVYLIEVNTNPCLELSSPLLARLIPSMVENSLRIVVDPMFPPPENFSQKKHILHDLCPENKYELIFDEAIDGPVLEDIFKEKANVIVEIDEEELSDVDPEEGKQCADVCD